MDIDEIIAKTERSLIEVSQSSNKSSFRPIHDVLAENYQKIEERSNNNTQITGIATGFYDFDKLTTGLHADQLIILAARPAMGKTAFALNIAQNVATKSNKAVAVFSLEMGAESLVERMLASEGTIESHHIRTGQLTVEEWQRLIYAQGELAEAPIFIDDTAGVKITDIRARARRLSQETDGLGLIVIDYLQLIQGSRSDNRQQEVSEISRQLKILAKELKVPVIALSQLSRSVEQRQDKRPIMSDLRESGSIEQDADIVAFLYRDDYYTDKSDDQPESNLTELIIKKNRHGSLGTVNLYFHKEYTKFSSVREEKMKKFDHYFSNHIAVKTELESATIVDYYNPEKGYEYNLRYIFDKKNSSLAITGDFGELVARNFYNMGEWDTFYKHYTENLGYFLEKLLCSTRPVHYYDTDKAKREILNEFFDGADYDDLDFDDEFLLDQLFDNFDEDKGFTYILPDAFERFSEDMEDYVVYEFLSRAGRYVNEVFELYLDAYKRAYEYLTKEVDDGTTQNV